VCLCVVCKGLSSLFTKHSSEHDMNEVMKHLINGTVMISNIPGVLQQCDLVETVM
jgi:hypothetical protein